MVDLTGCEAPTPFDACSAFRGLSWGRDGDGVYYTPVLGLRALLGVTHQALTQWTTPRSVSDFQERSIRSCSGTGIPRRHPCWAPYARSKRLAVLSAEQILAYVCHVYRLGEHTVDAEVWEDVLRLRAGASAIDPRQARRMDAAQRAEVRAAMDELHRARRQVAALPAWHVSPDGRTVRLPDGAEWPAAWFVSACLTPLCARLGYTLVPARDSGPVEVHRPLVRSKRRRQEDTLEG